MERWAGKVAVVTGASSGIGLSTATMLYVEGMIVIGLARRKTQMKNNMRNVQGKGQFHAVECDVSKEESVSDAFAWIKKNFGTVHVLLNNAGFVITGTFLETSREDWENVFAVNVMGLLSCAKNAISMMKEADVEGHIINVSSIEGHRVYLFDNVFFSAYPATKHAVNAISEGLEKELRGGKIRVTNISPGLTATAILSSEFSKECTMSNHPLLNPEDIANAIVYAIGTPQHVQIAEMIIRPLGEKAIA